jgi:hypothetical protein
MQALIVVVLGALLVVLLNKNDVEPILTSLATCLSEDENYNRLVVALITDDESSDTIY